MTLGSVVAAHDDVFAASVQEDLGHEAIQAIVGDFEDEAKVAERLAEFLSLFVEDLLDPTAKLRRGKWLLGCGGLTAD